ncbi:acyloxyacyl hydrolase [Tropicibacter naphthalenivorans]|uniref:Lipid A 3-O-deacylase (PagL) n=1 Tax=Tropicibacter naphthalenivorans TaxID=441103 RepID=A0A0P1GS67_9RHOB|nr:acyloxyacyl hydrolase [Tropicibacter naphthalenivorans]CUH78518.1 Lipid A 3-O-deacylase (PagL) [Tropicibacter naphthalenivorans]SMC80836.1 Lipid A 3-O-deacylase (PagL) [Tropicibacter naphthalenivorans]
MADGTFAVLLMLLGWSDMSDNYCDTAGGCWAPSDRPAQLMLSQGEVIRRRAHVANESYVRYDLGTQVGPFGQAAGFSAGEEGELWAGYGLTYTMRMGAFYAELHLMPGLYLDNGGFDMGGLLEFRSGLELGLESADGWRVGLAYDHRSNGGIFEANPGKETLQVRFGAPAAVPLPAD